MSPPCSLAAQRCTITKRAVLDKCFMGQELQQLPAFILILLRRVSSACTKGSRYGGRPACCPALSFPRGPSAMSLPRSARLPPPSCSAVSTACVVMLRNHPWCDSVSNATLAASSLVWREADLRPSSPISPLRHSPILQTTGCDHYRKMNLLIFD